MEDMRRAVTLMQAAVARMCALQESTEDRRERELESEE